jgi:Cu(I)/Ag(I) efflux system membrane fusion protein/cobalt-zinc-cadmium efflux system membrane fusion protein
MEMKKNLTKVDDIIRKGVIDLQSIDKNKDGKVFQDLMDWNVISDKAGKCPLCKMTLKEVTLDETKKNLIKNGFKVK